VRCDYCGRLIRPHDEWCEVVMSVESFRVHEDCHAPLMFEIDVACKRLGLIHVPVVLADGT
jgi:hypothetical protein